jgi:type II secretory pathway pseudopilin PulG
MKTKLGLKSKKGISLVEILIYLALIGLVLQGVLGLMIYGFDSYNTNFNLVQQEKTISDAISALRKDIESASSVNVDSTKKILTLKLYNSAVKVWTLDVADNSLKVGSTQVVDGIDVSNSNFYKQSGRLILEIKPIETNTKKYKNRNYTEPIITEFSVRYKN